MKPLLFLAFVALPLLLRAADPTAALPPKDLRQLLQQGLFEEEATRDYEKASAAYGALVAEYDRQRALAATALFRLAEIRAKQGNKAEAVALHQRLLAEFPGHDPLAKLSRERLAGLGAPADRPGVDSLSPEYATRLRDELASLRIELATMSQTYQAKHPKVIAVQTRIDAIEALLNPAPPIAVTEDEAKELARVREMAKNSPDLLNAVTSNPEHQLTTPLSRAAARGWVQVATFLLEQGAKVNGPGKSELPLNAAAREGHKRMVELLLERGADVNGRDARGDAALIVACAESRAEVASLLLAKGADPNIADDRGYTALHGACKARNIEIARMLLEKGADPNAVSSHTGGSPGGSPVGARGGGTPLWQGNTAELMLLLLENGADPNIPSPNGSTLLGRVSAEGNEALVKMLLAHGAKLDLANSSDGYTPLHYAARTQSVSLVRLLLEHGAPPNAANAGGATAFHISLTRGQSGFLESDRRNAIPRIQREQTPAGQAMSAEVVENLHALWEALLAKGADINARDTHGRTPLHYAIGMANLPSGHGVFDVPEESALWLINRGADLQSKDDQGQTPLAYAKGKRRLFFEKRLVFPKLTKERVITGLARVASFSSDEPPVTPVAEFEAPPTLVEFLREKFGTWARDAIDTSEIVIYRGTGDESVKEVVRGRMTLPAGESTLRFGNEADPKKWPALYWGDVVVFEEGPRAQQAVPIPPGGPITDLFPRKPKRVTVQLGNRTGELEIGEIRIKSPPPSAPAPGARVRIRKIGVAEDEANVWQPNEPLKWSFSELITRTVAAEARAELDAVKMRRTVDEKPQEWTVDVRGEGGVKDLPARLADGDQIIIPLRPPDDADALARRRAGIFQAAAGRVLGQRIFESKAQENTPPTLCEFLMQSYLFGEMIVPLPDLSKITIHRLKGEAGEEETLSIDLRKAIASVSNQTTPEESRALDVPLHWGDVVEVAPLPGDAKQWAGFSAPTVFFLQRVLTREVSWNSAANAGKVSLKPVFAAFRTTDALERGGVNSPHSPFSVQALLSAASIAPEEIVRLAIRSGDGVREFTSEQIREMDLWLRDGDSVGIERL